jgi:hypothetical protein
MSENQPKLGKGKKSTLERKASDMVAAWNRFLLDEGGVYPPKLAAASLKITVQAVYSASEKGWIKYFRIGRERFYSCKDVHNYRWTGSRKYRDNLPGPQYKGAQDATPELTLGQQRQKAKLDEMHMRAARRNGWIP